MHNYREALFCALQHLLPQHALSRLLARLAEARRPWLKNLLIRSFVKHYNVDLTLAQHTSPCEYANFNEFFTRPLKAGARPIAENKNAIVAPADGVISQLGQVSNGSLIQAKGHDFSVASLLNDVPLANKFADGAFFTIYLSPKDYHRVHMPMAGQLTRCTYIPGKLFSVNNATAARIPGLFARNERLVCVFDSAHGPVAVVLVGAMLVAGIETVWQDAWRPRILATHNYQGQSLAYAKGEEIGRFKFGSTVIVLLPKPAIFANGFTAGSAVCMGESLARCAPQEHRET